MTGSLSKNSTVIPNRLFRSLQFPDPQGEKGGQLVRPNTMVITESAARRYFAGGDPIGKVLTFRTSSSEQHFEVTGVIADMPYNSHLHYDFLLSYSTIPEARRDIWYIHGVYTYVRLEPERNRAILKWLSIPSLKNIRRRH